ncbi:MAG: beta galactosidase jelly roll domain-containing protein, partial [Chloroflexi bacterium]|nr:beta galactosidase jelly roll domain-containing protein [Chloroflexota bacterium]
MSREHTSLDGTWQFWIDPQHQYSFNTLDCAEDKRSIHVPAPWQAQFDDLHFYSGVAWYRRTFALPTNSHARGDTTHVLHFGAVDYFTTVWLNGVELGSHEGGYLPFEFQLDHALHHDAPNELVVRVIDPGDDGQGFPQFAFSEIPHGKQSWYGPIGGIWQSVYVEQRHAIHLTRLHITPFVEQEQARVDVRLNAPAPDAMSLRLTLTDPKGAVTQHEVALAAGTLERSEMLSIPEPILWDTRDPQLYHLKAALLGRDELDVLGAKFGMRSIAASPNGHLMLNGRTLYLRGALDQDYYPHSIYTPFSDEELDAQFAKAKHMGLNCLRTHIKIADPRYYEAADRAGILIWTELPNWINLTDAVERRARETLQGMVERDWNHPSIVIWTIVNEGWGVDLAMNEKHRAWLAKTYDYVKEIDPHRLVVGNSACFTNFHVVTDIEDFHNYYSIPDHYAKWQQWVETFAARPPWTFASSYENIKTWREYVKDPWTPRERPIAPEVRRRGSEPMVVSEFGNWGLPDVEQLRACYGGKDPWWFETGLEWGEGAVYPHGVEQRFRTWHLDKVFPTFKHLVVASQRMQYGALKYQIEQMRKFPSIVGYIITEFTDVHWESNGLLDMCRNPKSFYDVIAEINDADSLVPDWQRVTFWEGERCEVRLAFSHFSNIELDNCRVEWELAEYPDMRGAFEPFTPEHAAITQVGTVVFDVPPMQKSERVRLTLRLLNGDGGVIATNHQELYFFPRRAGEPLKVRISAPPSLATSLRALGYTVTRNLEHADLAIAETMTDHLRAYVQNGGRVLWLAESKRSKMAYLGLDIVERKGRRWQGDWANNMNWIRQDAMFQNIPTNGLVDFAFADLTPEHVITNLKPYDFARDVHAGLFVGWIHHTV